jgi:hypothetical protein
MKNFKKCPKCQFTDNVRVLGSFIPFCLLSRSEAKSVRSRHPWLR